jgi:Bacterial archaeo-eukaryotic release factor family 3
LDKVKAIGDNRMNRHDVRLLQAIREYPSVSIFLPTYRTAPENLKDPIRLPAGPSGNSSAYRGEKSRQFCREAHAAFKEFAIDDDLPLIVAGVDRNLAFFQEVSNHTSAIIGTLRGNYDQNSVHELAPLVWPLVKANRAVQVDGMLSELDAAVSARRYASSITEVWHVAQEGRGSTLIVETDFHFPARLDESGQFLIPADDVTAPDVIDDAVDDVIEIVMSKGGKVVFVADGVLDKYQHIAMTLRY